jgi:hypothetical protein
VSETEDSGDIDFFVGFAGEETMIDAVAPFVSSLVKQVALYGLPEEWVTITRVVAENQSVLQGNTVVGAFRIGNKVEMRALRLHSNARPFGFKFKECPNSECPSKKNSFCLNGITQRRKVRIQCVACGWKSGSAVLAPNKYFRTPQGFTNPTLFEYQYPPPTGLKTFFSDLP